MPTPREILHAAYGYSTKNKPGTIATEATELLAVVVRALQGLYAIAARVNPAYFGVIAPVSWDTDGWPIPDTVEALVRVEFTPQSGEPQGQAIHVVPFDDLAAEPFEPCVFHWGKKLRPAGNENDPASTDVIQIWYSKRPETPPDLDTDIDPTWPEQFTPLLILEVAIYLALKDERTAEVAELKALRDPWARLYLAHLEHFGGPERRAIGHVRIVPTNAMVSIGELFAGGASLAGAEAA